MLVVRNYIQSVDKLWSNLSSVLWSTCYCNAIKAVVKPRVTIIIVAEELCDE